MPVGLLVPPVGISNLETMHDALEQTVQAKLSRLREQIAALMEVDGLIGRFVSEQARSEQLGNALIQRREESNASAKQQLDEKQLHLAPLPTPEILEASKNAYQTSTRELDTARQNRAGTLASLEQTTAALAAITAGAFPSKTLIDLSTEQNKNTIQLIELKSKIEAEQSALDRQNIWSGNRWIYLAVVMDLFARKPVGWA
ncbi:hypothetical protein AB7W84_18770, partial [Providencia rettgeri]